MTIRFSLKEIQSLLTRALLVALLAAAGVAQLEAQCAPGDILWVSETVNANVGTAAGGGGTGAQCALRTVAGAAYNSTVSPFGIQAALDCACPGAEIRVMAGAGEYGSTTASWNNRVSANKELQISVQGDTSSTAGPIGIVGYVGTSTRCESHQTAGCPVDVDFATAVGGNGLRTFVSGFGYYVVGLHLKNAASTCFFGTGQGYATLSMEYSGCTDGFNQAATGNAGLFGYGHDMTSTTGTAQTTASSGSHIFTEVHDNLGFGIGQSGGLATNNYERALSYDNRIALAAAIDRFTVMFSTLVGSTGGGITSDGWTGGSMQAQNGGFGVLATGNDGWGMEAYGNAQDMSMWQCFAAGGNTTGSITGPAPPGPVWAGIRDTADTATVPTFASATDFNATGLEACTFTFPDGGTTLTSCPGVSPDCAGGGLFLQPVRVVR